MTDFKIVLNSKLKNTDTQITNTLSECKNYVIENNFAGFSRDKNIDPDMHSSCVIDKGEYLSRNKLIKDTNYNYYFNDKKVENSLDDDGLSESERIRLSQKIPVKFSSVVPKIFGKEYLEKKQDMYILDFIPNFEIVGKFQETLSRISNNILNIILVRKKGTEDDPNGKTIFFSTYVDYVFSGDREFDEFGNIIDSSNKPKIIEYKYNGEQFKTQTERQFLEKLSYTRIMINLEKNDLFDSYLIIREKDLIDLKYEVSLIQGNSFIDKVENFFSLQLNIGQLDRLAGINQYQTFKNKDINYEKLTDVEDISDAFIPVRAFEIVSSSNCASLTEKKGIFYNLPDINNISNYLIDKPNNIVVIKKVIESYSALESPREGEDLSEQFRRKKQEEKQEEKSRSIYYLVFILVVLFLTISFFIVKSKKNE